MFDEASPTPPEGGASRHRGRGWRDAFICVNYVLFFTMHVSPLFGRGLGEAPFTLQPVPDKR